MDAFETMLQALYRNMGEEWEKEIAKLKEECICPDCPTYNECAGKIGEKLYCFLGKSPECIENELGCSCPDCPITVRAELENLYYCTGGSEMEMRKG
ncbi:MAG: DUF2769 domain-containing protein [Methanomassiliicoccus sp.]|nr:DUF2769 domain-containing protein [Methanomassiliicoccus sp.]